MKPLRTIATVLLALLVLVSSTNFMVGVHFCSGQIQNIALFTKAEGCAKEQKLPPCHRHMKAPCCEDETVIHNAEDFKASPTHFNINAPAAIDLEQSMVVIAEIIPATPAARVKYYNYDPPLRSSDFTVAYQVFII